MVPRLAFAEVEIRLHVGTPAARCEVTGFTSIAPDGKETALPLARSLTVGHEEVSATVDRRDSNAALLPVTPGCWSDPIAASQPLVAELWPAVTVRGEFEIAEAAELPRSIVGTFGDAGKARTDEANAIEHVARCSLEKLAWSCQVPAGRPIHLKLSVADFAPVYLWDLEAREEVVNTGAHPLLRGAGVVGRVVSDDGTPIGNALVSLIPVTAAHFSATDRQLTEPHARSNAKGYFQFVGVSPGWYRLASKMRGLGDAIGEKLLEIRSSQDLRLREDLGHRPMAEVEVVITPPTTKAGRRWRVALTREGNRLHETVREAEGTVRVDGVWTHGGLQPGSYLLYILDEGTEIAQRSIELRGGLERVLVAADAIEVRGRVLSGVEPVQGTVQFDMEGRRVKVSTDDDGIFRASFPVAGTWLPSLFPGASSGEVRLPPVEIRAPHDGELLLEVAGGRISGRVVGLDGKAVRAAVHVRRDRRLVAQCTTRDDGRFELIGLTEGSYFVDGETEDAFAGPISVSVVEDERTEIELRVERAHEISGLVLTSTGLAASGAIVRSVDSSGFYEDVIADARGAFSLQVKAGERFVDLIFFAPPHPVTVRRVSVAEKRITPLAPIQLPAEGATLRLYVQHLPPWPVLVTADGRAYSLGLLAAPRFGSPRLRESINGGFEFVIEPGTYVCCDGPACRTVQMASHAETVVDFVTPTPGGTP
jgi:hypothetical protein